MKGFIIAVILAGSLIGLAVVFTMPSGSMREKVMGEWKLVEFNKKPTAEVRVIELSLDTIRDSNEGETKVTWEDKPTIAIAKNVSNGAEVLRATIRNDGCLVTREKHPLMQDVYNESIFEKTTHQDGGKVE